MRKWGATPMRISLILSLLLLSALPAAARYDAGSPETPRHPDPAELGQLFCQARVTGDMTLLDGHLAGVLLESIGEAEKKLEAFRTQYPNATHPFSNELPWQTYPDRPSRCATEIVNGIDKAPVVLVKLSYFVPGNPDAKWSDTIQMDRTPTSWLIDNVFYANGGNMRFKLFEAFNS
jgi:hypothetical protein